MGTTGDPGFHPGTPVRLLIKQQQSVHTVTRSNYETETRTRLFTLDGHFESARTFVSTEGVRYEVCESHPDAPHSEQGVYIGVEHDEEIDCIGLIHTFGERA